MVFSLKVNNILTLFLKLNLHVIFVIFFFYYFSPLDYTIARRGTSYFLVPQFLLRSELRSLTVHKFFAYEVAQASASK